MSRGEVVHMRVDEGPWHAYTVLVPFGDGVGPVLASFRRHIDGQRVLAFRDGTWREVPG